MIYTLLILWAAFACCPFSAIITRSREARIVSDPSYQDSVDCSNEVSRLANEANRLLAEHQEVERRCDRSLQYYRDMIASVKETIKIYEAGVEKRDSDEELVQRYRARYTSMMCMKTYEAFILEDEDARLEILHICIGRTPLAPSTFLRHRGQDEEPCQQAQDMQDRVDMLRSEKAAKVAECRTKKQTLKNELQQRRAEEDRLEDKYYGHHQNKAEIRSEVAANVTGTFCPVIQGNYRVNEDNIKRFWEEKCSE